MTKASVLAVLCFFLALPAAAQPEEGSAGIAVDSGKGFHVTGSILRAEAEKAELCLSLSDPADVADRGEVLSSLVLIKNGQKQKIAGTDLSLTPHDICIQGLEHRQKYEVALRKLESLDGEKLSTPFTVTVDVPDRKQVLNFVADANLAVLPRHIADKSKKAQVGAGMAHILRSVNVLATHLTLYRMPSRDLLSGAWQQFRQNNLSPAESLTFARNKGQVIFESDLVFGDKPNVEQTLVAPLPADEELKPGLYFLSAAPRGKDAAKPSLFAGQWFLVSDLRLMAVRIPGGMKVFAAQDGTTKPAAGVSIQWVKGGDGKVLAEAQTAADGTAFWSMPAQKASDPVLVTGELASGDIDIIEPAREGTFEMGSVATKAMLSTDRTVYQSGSTASLMLRAVNPDGTPQTFDSSVVRLLRPDRRVYSEYSVPSGSDGVSLINVPLPVSGTPGAWALTWQKADGTTLAEAPIRLMTEATGGSVDLHADKEIIDLEGPLSVTIRAVNAMGKPLAFAAGKLVVKPARPDLPAWKGYRFGVGAAGGQSLREVDFMTNADGTARVPVSFDQDEAPDMPAVDALSLSASFAHGLGSKDVTLPVKRATSLIGVKSLTDGKAFAENSVARFQFVAVDSTGKRQSANDLYFLIYEEGRNFEWFASEGYWDYKPLPHHRRVGGGRLSISASGEALLSWPVTIGHYVLEVTNGAGDILAHHPFDAGRGAALLQGKDDMRLAIAEEDDVLEAGKPNKIKINLSAPAMVNAIIADHAASRQVIFKPMQAGVNVIELTPESDWDNQAVLRIQALFEDQLRSAVIERRYDIRHASKELALDIASPSSAISGAGLSVGVKVQNIAKNLPTHISAVGTALAEDGRTNLPVVRLDKIPLDAEGRAQLKLNVPHFSGEFRLNVMAWNQSQFGSKVASVPAQPALKIEGEPPEYLTMGDRASVSLTLINTALPEGDYTYDIKLPSGVSGLGPLKGKVNLKKQRGQIIPFSLQGQEAVEDVIHFELTGPAGFKMVQAWPLVVRSEAPVRFSLQRAKVEAGQGLALPLPLEKGKGEKIVAALVAPMPLPDVTSPLQKLIRAEPQTTQEIAHWLEITALWENTIRTAGLISDLRFETLRTQRLRTLQMRQNDDGGFAVMKAGGPSDILSTAAAYMALQSQAERPASLAAAWLTQKLQNTWFDESEREARALAFQVLARTKKADISSLRYFAETSRENKISPLGAAAIADALASTSEDEEAAKNWIGETMKTISGDPGLPQQWEVLDLLSANPLVKTDEVQPILEKAEVPLIENAFIDSASFLASVARVAIRYGSWVSYVNGGDIKIEGVMPIDLDRGEGGSVQFKNGSSQPLYILQFAEKKGADKETAKDKESETLTVQRQLYRLDGSRIESEGSLAVGETYLLVIKADGKKRKMDLVRVTLPVSSAFGFETLDGGKAVFVQRSFPWLSEPTMDVLDDIASSTGFSFGAESAGALRAAVLVKALRRGDYTMPAVRMRASSGEIVSISQSPMRFTVR